MGQPSGKKPVIDKDEVDGKCGKWWWKKSDSRQHGGMRPQTRRGGFCGLELLILK